MMSGDSPDSAQLLLLGHRRIKKEATVSGGQTCRNACQQGRIIGVACKSVVGLLPYMGLTKQGRGSLTLPSTTVQGHVTLFTPVTSAPQHFCRKAYAAVACLLHA